MAVDVLTETVIERPRRLVASYAGNPVNAPSWYANIASMKWRSPGPVRVGSEIDFVARFLGRTLTYTYVVTEYVEGYRLVMRTTQGPFPMETTYIWATVHAGATRMTLRNRGEPRGFSRLSGPLVTGAVHRANRKDLARLKDLLEAR